MEILVEKGAKQYYVIQEPVWKEYQDGAAWVCKVAFTQFGEEVKPLTIIPLFKKSWEDDPETWVAVSSFYDLLDNVQAFTMPGYESVFVFHSKAVIDKIKKSEAIIEKMVLKLANIPFSLVTMDEVKEETIDGDK